MEPPGCVFRASKTLILLQSTGARPQKTTAESSRNRHYYSIRYCSSMILDVPIRTYLRRFPPCTTSPGGSQAICRRRSSQIGDDPFEGPYLNSCRIRIASRDISLFVRQRDPVRSTKSGSAVSGPQRWIAARSPPSSCGTSIRALRAT